jgi:hypothetical protein
MHQRKASAPKESLPYLSRFKASLTRLVSPVPDRTSGCALSSQSQTHHPNFPSYSSRRPSCHEARAPGPHSTW